jgi:hypothetical protein
MTVNCMAAESKTVTNVMVYFKSDRDTLLGYCVEEIKINRVLKEILKLRILLKEIFSLIIRKKFKTTNKQRIFSLVVEMALLAAKF